MFPFQISCDNLVSEDPWFIQQEQNQNLIAYEKAPVLKIENSDIPNEGFLGQTQRVAGCWNNKRIDKVEFSNETKKKLHREVEKERRKEMASLYASLRQILPYEYLKGKRAISDHIQQAVKYIKFLEKRVEQLRIQRDKSNKLSKPLETAKPSDYYDQISSTVKVNLCNDGLMEVLIINGSKLNQESSFPLSKVLLELIGRGLNTISCSSTIINGQSLHKIQSKAIYDVRSIDISELQERLVKVIKSF